jgi:hypothetical protein
MRPQWTTWRTCHLDKPHIPSHYAQCHRCICLRHTPCTPTSIGLCLTDSGQCHNWCIQLIGQCPIDIDHSDKQCTPMSSDPGLSGRSQTRTMNMPLELQTFGTFRWDNCHTKQPQSMR